MQGVAQEGGQLPAGGCQGAGHHLSLAQDSLPGLPLGLGSLLLPLLSLRRLPCLSLVLAWAWRRCMPPRLLIAEAWSGAEVVGCTSAVHSQMDL